MSYYDDDAQAAKLDKQREQADLSNSRADVPREYQNPASTAEYYLELLKTARGLPCLCGLCRQIIDEEIKTMEKLI